MCVCGHSHLPRALDQKQAVLADGVQRVEDLGVELGQRAPALAGSPRAAVQSQSSEQQGARILTRAMQDQSVEDRRWLHDCRLLEASPVVAIWLVGRVNQDAARGTLELEHLPAV